MKKVFNQIGFMVIVLAILITGCKKTETTSWNITATADLGGSFDIIGTADITIEDNLFTALITTSSIGGASEVYDIEMTGTVSGSTLSVEECEFVLNTANGNEYVTINTAEINKGSSTLSGDGTMTVIPAGMTTPITGTFTIVGTEK